MQLRDGSYSYDARLGRVKSFDERSRNYPVRRQLPAGADALRSKNWRCDPRLNQGETPRCVGFAFTHDDACAPIRRKVVEALADKWYHTAQDNDEWAGSSYAGSSTLGGAKAGIVLKKFTAYHWAFSLNELLLGLSHLGPFVMGTTWRRDMFNPDARGLVHYSGPVDGGHEWLLKGIDIAGEEVIGRNSWGLGWGYKGDFRMSFADLGRVLEEEADAVQTGRS